MTDVHRLEDDAPRYVIEVLSKVGPLDADDLASHYDPPKPNDLADVRESLRDGPRQATNYEAKFYLIEDAIEEINRHNRDYVIETDKVDEDEDEDDEEIIEEVLIQDGKGRWQLADGVDVDKLVLRNGEPLISKSQPLPDLFSPEAGLWNDNFGRGDIDPKKDRELIQSLREFGWPKGLEAIHDERGVSLTGGRREAVARMPGIEPVIRVITFGDGPAADAQRAALKIASNLGGKPWSPEQRKQIAADLYGDGTKFSMEEVAKQLNVAISTVSRDLRGFADAKPPKSRGGRPRKKSKGDPEPEPQPEPEPEPTPEPQPEPTPEPQPQPEPQHISTVMVVDDTDLDIEDLIADVGADLDRLTAYIMSLDTLARSRAFDEHIDRVSALARKAQQTIKALTDAKSRPVKR